MVTVSNKEELAELGLDIEESIREDVGRISDIYGHGFSDKEISEKLDVPISLVEVVCAGLNRALQLHPDTRIQLVKGGGCAPPKGRILS